MSGNFFNFIEDAQKKPKLLDDMMAVLKNKDTTGKVLLDAFHNKGYDGVSLRDCSRILEILKDPAQAKKLEDWHY